MSPPFPRAIEPKRVPELYGITRSRLYDLLRTGKVRAKKDGSRTLILTASLDQYLESLEYWRPLPESDGGDDE